MYYLIPTILYYYDMHTFLKYSNEQNNILNHNYWFKLK